MPRRRASRDALAALVLAALADEAEGAALDALAAMLDGGAVPSEAARARFAGLGALADAAGDTDDTGARSDEHGALATRVAAARIAVGRYWRAGAPPRDPLERALVQAAELFAAGLYFEVHEVLEVAWRRLADPERRFVQGLIQTAVGLHHLAHGNAAGARAQLAAARVKLAPHAPAFRGVAVGALLAELPPWEEAAAAGRPWAPRRAAPRLRVHIAGGRRAGDPDPAASAVRAKGG